MSLSLTDRTHDLARTYSLIFWSVYSTDPLVIHVAMFCPIFRMSQLYAFSMWAAGCSRVDHGRLA